MRCPKCQLMHGPGGCDTSDPVYRNDGLNYSQPTRGRFLAYENPLATKRKPQDQSSEVDEADAQRQPMPPGEE